MEAGLKFESRGIVNGLNTAKALGSGDVEVYATPSMVALMEYAAKECVKPYLESSQTTVGTMMNVRHTASTPVGMKVRCESELLNVEGKKLTFSLKAYDDLGLIGEGTHERAIVDSEKFVKKTYEKLEK